MALCECSGALLTVDCHVVPPAEMMMASRGNQPRFCTRNGILLSRHATALAASAILALGFDASGLGHADSVNRLAVSHVGISQPIEVAAARTRRQGQDAGCYVVSGAGEAVNGESDFENVLESDGDDRGRRGYGCG